MALTFLPHPANEVYAMDLQGNGHINIDFIETSTGTVGMVLINTKNNVTIPLTLAKVGNNYTANLTLPKGDYKYGFMDSLVTNVTQTFYYFSVGIVIVVTGHSLAQSNGEQHATDDRVRIYTDYTARLESAWKDIAKYSGGSYRNPNDIYAAAVATNSNGLYDNFQVGPWARMAQLIAVRDDVTVAIINTAMGGSSVEMWADEAMERPFKHSFAQSVVGVEDYNLYNSGIPFSHFQNVLKTFGKRTGVTAVIVQHGENDMGKNPSHLGKFYQEFIAKAREGSGMAKLPFVIAKSAWLLNSSPETTQNSIDNTLAGVDEALRITNYTYFGIDTHLLPQSLRGQPNNAGDGHWNPEGSKEVGRMWAEKLTPAFLSQINNGISTLPNPTPTVIGEVITVPGNTQVPEVPVTSPLSKLNWVATGIIVSILAGILFLLKMFTKIKLFRKLSNIVLIVLSIGLGGIYLGVNYFTNKKRAL